MLISNPKKDGKAKVLIFDPKLDEEILRKENNKNEEADFKRRAILKKAFSSSEFESGQTDKKRKTLFAIQAINLTSVFKTKLLKLWACLSKLCAYFHSKIKLSFVYVVVTGR